MKNPAQIRQLAFERLEEAQILAQNGKYDGAFYLAGYSVELMLKAKVCERLGIDNLFDEQAQSGHGINEVRKALKTHDITVLLIFSGLKNLFDSEKSQKLELMEANSVLFLASGKCIWNEQSRYKAPGSQNSDDVKKLISLLKGNGGLLQWIEKS
ncbi:HEPN domain-containing protein [Crenothrix polyspora]|uniref:HEPN domain-containing protein n=1 Tax=Crenothrix polyspora TaxID=360316 RepID=A0A1R4HEW2_9GAMM|nr:HEPN domain-containing protein [Crenothrix polyspora]SJM94764.1 HEPN domain-containing protein [Crenothrix polyspora]